MEKLTKNKKTTYEHATPKTRRIDREIEKKKRWILIYEKTIKPFSPQKHRIFYLHF